jgi:hypothetical protein
MKLTLRLPHYEQTCVFRVAVDHLWHVLSYVRRRMQFVWRTGKCDTGQQAATRGQDQVALSSNSARQTNGEQTSVLMSAVKDQAAIRRQSLILTQKKGTQHTLHVPGVVSRIPASVLFRRQKRNHR